MLLREECLALGGTEVEEEDVTIHIAKLRKFLIGMEFGIALAPGFQPGIIGDG